MDYEIYEAIRRAGVDMVCSVPCAMLGGLLTLLDESSAVQHIAVTREEEGVGVAAGAYLGGRAPALLMQNSGLGNCINAIKSLLEIYEIPLLIVMSWRGTEGEKIVAQVPMGQATIPLLDAIGAETLIIRAPADLHLIEAAARKRDSSRKLVAVVLARSLWEGTQ